MIHCRKALVGFKFASLTLWSQKTGQGYVCDNLNRIRISIVLITPLVTFGTSGISVIDYSHSLGPESA